MVAPFISKHFCLSLLHKLHTFTIFSFFCLSQIHQIFALLRPGLFIFWSVFSALVGPVRWLNSAVSDMAVFDLTAGGGDLAGPWASSAPATLAGLPSLGRLGLWALHTATIHSLSAHRIENELFGGQWQCRECWAQVPLWEKNGISFSVTLFSLPPCLRNVSAAWWEGSLGALADLFPLFCRFQSSQSEQASKPEES